MNMAAKSLEDLNVLPVALAMTEPVYTKALFGPKLLSLEKLPLQLNLPASSVAVERGRRMSLRLPLSALTAERGTDSYSSM